MPAVTKYIYVMQRVRKAHQDKLILDDVTLAFLPGAKIGVVGPNGAGKSTVLEIMAGLETISNGEAALAPGPASASCSRSRSWTRPRTCSATSRRAWPRPGPCWPGSRS
jgi:ATPase subunit of ABC transporter with duplicated ATPase domains